MTHFIDGKSIAKAIHLITKERVEKLAKKGSTPKLAVVLIGDDKPSKTYVEKKQKAAEKIGIGFELHAFPSSTEEAELRTELKHIQGDPTLTGLIIQLPIPPQFYPHVINDIHPELDVDCLTETNLGKLVMETNIIAPPTPGAVFAILEDLDIDLTGRNVTIVGTGILVGKPLAIMLANKEASVTTCNIHTTNTKEKCLQADIIVSAVGKKDLIRGDMVKVGAIVIDAGVNFESGHMFGDVNIQEVEQIASYLTPTPGGVGPITVAKLLENVVTLAEQQYENSRCNSNIQ